MTDLLNLVEELGAFEAHRDLRGEGLQAGFVLRIERAALPVQNLRNTDGLAGLRYAMIGTHRIDRVK